MDGQWTHAGFLQVDLWSSASKHQHAGNIITCHPRSFRHLQLHLFHSSPDTAWPLYMLLMRSSSNMTFLCWPISFCLHCVCILVVITTFVIKCVKSWVKVRVRWQSFPSRQGRVELALKDLHSSHIYMCFQSSLHVLVLHRLSDGGARDHTCRHTGRSCFLERHC